MGVLQFFDLCFLLSCLRHIRLQPEGQLLEHIVHRLDLLHLLSLLLDFFELLVARADLSLQAVEHYGRRRQLFGDFARVSGLKSADFPALEPAVAGHVHVVVPVFLGVVARNQIGRVHVLLVDTDAGIDVEDVPVVVRVPNQDLAIADQRSSLQVL